MPAKPSRELWQRLSDQNLVSAAYPEHVTTTPWYIRVLTGFAGWMAAAFLFGFVATLFASLIESFTGSFIMGCLVLAGAIWLYRNKEDSDFFSQLSLVISLCGQGFIAFALVQQLENNHNMLAFIAFVIQLLLLFVIRDFTHRLWSSLMMLCSLFFLLANNNLYEFSATLFLGLFVTIWLNEFTFIRHQALIRPVAYCITLAVMLAIVQVSSPGDALLYLLDGQHASSFRSLGSIIISAVIFISTGYQLLTRSGVQADETVFKIVMAVCLVIAVFSYWAPGIVYALMILLLGFMHANRILFYLGIASSLAYLSYYYYQLDFTLLTKSLILMLLGTVFLAVRVKYNSASMLRRGV